MNKRNTLPDLCAESLRIKALRQKYGYSPSQLAESTGIPADTLNAYETGRKYPSDEDLYTLADFFHVTYDQLRGLTPTGFPSVDQPWHSVYPDEAYTTPLPECSIYDLIYKNNSNRLNEPAIDYANSKVTYGQMFTYIEKASNSFRKMGVKAGDIVSMMLPNIPENVYCLYALNHIGAIANMVDFRLTGAGLIDSIESVHSKIVICCDLFSDSVAEIQDKVQVEHWVMISPFESTPQLIRGFLKLRNRNKAVGTIKHKIKWSEFLKYGLGYTKETQNTENRQSDTDEFGCVEKISTDVASDYTSTKFTDSVSACTKSDSSDAVACIFHTSGTTSMPKSVMLTNKNMNSLAFCYQFVPADLKPGDRFLSNIPPFLAYNIIFSLHMPLVQQMTVVMIAKPSLTDFVDTLIKLKPNHVGGASSMWRAFSRDPKAENADFSYLKGLASGNDVLSVADKTRANELLKRGGCKYDIVEGYGMTEAGTCVSSYWTGITPLDSIGVPLFINIMSIFDENDPDRELTYGEVGEICIHGPSVMPGYYGDAETTAQVLKRHSDGRIWLHSGDLGHVDETGCFFFDGRMKRTIVTFKGFKLAPMEMERLISTVDNIDSCCVVGQPDEEMGAGQVPVAFLVLKDPGKETETVAEVKELVEKNVPDEYYMRRYVVIERLPLTANGKVDFKGLERMK